MTAILLPTICYVKLNYAGQDDVQEEAKHGDLWGDRKRQWIWKTKGLHSHQDYTSDT